MSEEFKIRNYVLNQTTSLQVVAESGDMLSVLIGDEPGLKASIARQDLVDGVNSGSIVELIPEPEQEANDLRSSILKHVSMLLHEKNVVQHAEIDIDELSAALSEDETNDAWRQKEDGYNAVIEIIKEKHGDPVYHGVGHAHKGYDGPSNPGFLRIYEAHRIAWWDINGKFVCVRISTTGGENPFLILEVYNPQGSIHS